MRRRAEILYLASDPSQMVIYTEYNTTKVSPKTSKKLQSLGLKSIEVMDFLRNFEAKEAAEWRNGNLIEEI